MGSKKPQRSCRTFSKAIDIEPNDAEGYYCREIAYSQRGKGRSACKELTKAIKLDPAYFDYYYWRGVTIMSIDRKEDSKIHKVGCSDLKKTYSSQHEFTQEYVQENRTFLSQQCPYQF